MPYLGGLLEHVVSLMDSCPAARRAVPGRQHRPAGDGCFLHDIGKIDELSYDRDFAYTDEGQLIGHLVMAVGILDMINNVAIAEAEKLSGETFPQELALRLKHMIVSHHGQYEFGSPKLPMTLEVVAPAPARQPRCQAAQLPTTDGRRSEHRQQLDQSSTRTWAASCIAQPPRWPAGLPARTGGLT